MVERLTSRKLAAFLGGLLYQAGLLVLTAFKDVDVAAIEKAQWMGMVLTLTALGAQSVLDWLKVKNGAPTAAAPFITAGAATPGTAE